MGAYFIPTGFEDYEPVVPDARLNRVLGLLLEEWPDLGGAELVTFIQPRKEVKDPNTGLYVMIEPMAVFAVVSDNPRYPGFKTMHTGTASLADWREADTEYSHYAHLVDPLLTIYRKVLPRHIETIKNLEAMN